MPFIDLKTNIEITSEKEKILKTKLGKSAQCIGKSENWLMIGFEDKCRLYFRGDNSQPMAFVEVKLYGRADRKSYDNMTGEITEILNEVLGIDPVQIYVKYEEVQYWGYNGNNF